MKKLVLLLFPLITLFTLQLSGAKSEPLHTDYPHWNFENSKTYSKLERINSFIEQNRNKEFLAIFDWDGTIYNEHIPVKELNDARYSGQAAYHIWTAINSDAFPFKPFPMFWTKDGKFAENVIEKNNFLEGHANVTANGYSKFTQIPLFTSGMTPQEFEITIDEYLKQYRPDQYAFLPMLDVLQKMLDEGVNVWIITGSNHYFVGYVLKYIQENIKYSGDKYYNFQSILSPTEKSVMHIAGNGMKLMHNKRFSAVYDNTFTQNPEKKLYIVDREGKEIVVKNLEKWSKAKTLFVAGNSDGDLWDSEYILERSTKGFGIAVNPTQGSKLRNFSKHHEKQIVLLNAKDLLSQQQ